MYLEKQIRMLATRTVFVCDNTFYEIIPSVDLSDSYVVLCRNILTNINVIFSKNQMVNPLFSPYVPDGYIADEYGTYLNVKYYRAKKIDYKIRPSETKISHMIGDTNYVFSVHRFVNVEKGAEFIVYDENIQSLDSALLNKFTKNTNDMFSASTFVIVLEKV